MEARIAFSKARVLRKVPRRIRRAVGRVNQPFTMLSHDAEMDVTCRW
jgi:hypothetical protein